MTDIRVRPAVRWFAIAASVILLPFAAHSLWDYVELRRLVREIEAIQAKGEPVSERQMTAGHPSASDDPTAASYYAAGAMLALPLSPYLVVGPVHEWLAQADPDPAMRTGFAHRLRALVDAAPDALALADRGANMPFAEFPPGTEFNYRTAGIASLSRLVEARTVMESIAGGGAAAAASALSGVRLRRGLRNGRPFGVSAEAVPAMLSLSEPPNAALERLQDALEQNDVPDREVRDVLRARAAVIDMIWRRYYGSDPLVPRNYRLPMRSVPETIARPWLSHRFVATLRIWQELVDAARTPWPEKTSAIAAVRDRYPAERHWNPGPFNGITSTRWVLSTLADAVDARQLIVDRASRVALAVERYRRDHAAMPGSLDALVPRYLREVPADPYTGRPLLMKATANSYTVYSVGTDGKDDGGDLTSKFERVLKQGYGPRVIAGADIGVRVVRLRTGARE